MTTVPQMVNRSNSGHFRVALAVAMGQPVTTAIDSLGSIKGKRVVADTLHRWGVVNKDGKITETGIAFLRAYKAKRPN